MRPNRIGKTGAVMLVMLPALLGAEQGTWQPSFAAPGKMVDVGGYRLHLNCTGRGDPAVVLIAGAGDFSFDWGLVRPGISTSNRVCSYDRAGLAWSDPGPTPRTMKQDTWELHALLSAAGISPPYVLVGHSIGGLIARVYAREYPHEVAGMVLVDPTHENTTLFYQGKLVRVRDGASGVAVPPVQSMQSSPPRPPAAEDIEQFEFNRRMFGPPKIEPPFDQLPDSVRAIRLWFLSQPPRAAAGPDFWADELQGLYLEWTAGPYPLGSLPLVVLLPEPQPGDPPAGVTPDEWSRVNDEKWKQKLELTNLSRNSRLIVVRRSGHHIQLDAPGAVVGAVHLVANAVRHGAKLAPD